MLKKWQATFNSTCSRFTPTVQDKCLTHLTWQFAMAMRESMIMVLLWPMTVTLIRFNKLCYFVCVFHRLFWIAICCFQIKLIWWYELVIKKQGRLQIFGTMHKKMQISLKWLKYRLKILKSSFIYYFYIVPVVPKLKKLKKSPYDQNNRNWMSHWHHANYHIFCNFHWKFGTQPLKPFISIST